MAPFGRRAARVLDRRRCGSYVVLRCADPEGPRPQGGQFYMLTAAERWGGGAGERPFLPRAFSVLRARTGPGGTELEFLLEDVGPGSKRLCELGPGDELLLLGPLGAGFEPPAAGRRPLLVGGGVGIAPLAICRTSSARRRPRCWASGTPRAPRAPLCCTQPWSPPTMAASATMAS